MTLRWRMGKLSPYFIHYGLFRMKKVSGLQFPELEKTLFVKVKFIAGSKPTDISNLAKLPYTPFFLLDYLQRNATTDISITHCADPAKLASSPNIIAYNTAMADFDNDTLTHQRNLLENFTFGKNSSWPLGNWYYTDDDFSIFCDALKKATNLKFINFTFLDLSPELTNKLVSALKVLPSIKIAALDCGETLTNALKDLEKEKPGSVCIASYTQPMKPTVQIKNISKPFDIHTIDMRIINGFIGACGLSAIIAAFFLIPTAIAITTAVLGTVALATGAYGFFTTMKQPPIQTLLNLDNACSLK